MYKYYILELVLLRLWSFKFRGSKISQIYHISAYLKVENVEIFI